MDDLHWKVLSLSECKWSDWKPIFLNENERFAVLFAEREKLFAETFLSREIWKCNAKTMEHKSRPQLREKFNRKLYYREWWLMTVTNPYRRQLATSRKCFGSHKNIRHEEEFNKKSFFIFPFSVSPSSMGFSQSGFWVARKARRKRFIKMCCSKAYWFAIGGRLFI